MSRNAAKNAPARQAPVPWRRNEFRAIKNLPVDERWQLQLALKSGTRGHRGQQGP